MANTPPVGADTSRPQRTRIERPVEWMPSKAFEFVGGGNLPPLNLAVLIAVR